MQEILSGISGTTRGEMITSLRVMAPFSIKLSSCCRNCSGDIVSGGGGDSHPDNISPQASIPTNDLIMKPPGKFL
jgi:hypothetical protein